MKATKRTGTVLLAGMLTLALSLSPGSAAPVVTDGLNLLGPDGTKWDAADNHEFGPFGPCYAAAGFTPAVGGTGPGPGNRIDAFDGALYFIIGPSTFSNHDDPGDLTGNTLTVGPKLTDGLDVTRKETAFTDRPTLRSLVKLRNPSSTPITRTVLWDSSMGADEDEATRASSSGDLTHTTADRWIVVSDGPDGNESDPPATFVFSGRKPRSPVSTVRFAPESPDPQGDGEACISVDYTVRVPANKTRYMLFFTEMHDSNAAAISDAAAYNSVTYGHDFLLGLSHAEKAGVLNWSFVCEGLGSKIGNHMVGTGGGDTLTGTPERDVICGGNGPDVINGGGGDDLLLGGPGDDKIRGAAGGDTLRGSRGADKLFGGGDDDKLFGDAGIDALTGGPGTDTCRGGGQGNDSLKECEE